MSTVVAPTRSSEALFIAALDISNFTRSVRGMTDEAIVEICDRFYLEVGTAAAASGGRVVKVIGDGALLAWPAASADAATAALVKLRSTVERSLRTGGLEISTLVIRAHAGTVVAGQFGPPQGRAFDIIGNDVNTVFQLPARTISLSSEAFRCLSPEARKAFKKHSAPVVYIPQDDQRP